MSEKSYVNWHFDNCKQQTEEVGRQGVKMFYVYLKIEFSVPAKSVAKSSKVGLEKENTKSLELLEDPIFSDFEIYVDGKIFHVS